MIGPRASGSNWLCCPYLVWNGVSYIHRNPRLRVSLGVATQSSWKYKEWVDHLGSQFASCVLKSARTTEPSRNAAKSFPVFGVNGKSVPPKRYTPAGSEAARVLARVRSSS